jgi:hypothetical protein
MSFNYYKEKIDKMSLEEQTNLIYKTYPSALQLGITFSPTENVRMWNIVKQTLCFKFMGAFDEDDEGCGDCDHFL